MIFLPRLLIAAFIVALAAMSLGTATAGTPPTYTVTRADDPAPDGCTPNDCSAREAFIDSNASAGTNTIIIPALHITLSITGTDDTGDKGDLDITDDVTISGVDPDNTIIDADLIDGVIDIPSPQGGGQSDVNVSIEGVAITSCVHSGINNTGFLTLENVVVFGNTSEGDGGGIDSPFGSLTMDHTTVGKNSSQGKGGGIASHGAAIVRNSTVWVNTGLDGGGGIWADGGLELFNSTVHDNSTGAVGGGGGVLIETAPGTFLNSTIADNSSSIPGGGVLNNGATVTISNTIIAGNTAGNVASDCLGALGGDYNLIQDSAGCILTGLHNITGQDPMLFDLGTYGGLTQTRAIPKDSPARDAGNNCQPEDQRGIPRPQGDGCDIGAYEYMFLGDLDCSGTVALPDITTYLRWLSIGDIPACSYRGDLQCNLDFGVTDVLFLVRALADTGLPPPARPDWCGEIGPFAP